MTDNINDRAAAQLLLAYADEWAAQAGELSPKASERACLDRATIHALLALHDALTDVTPEPDRYAANEAGADPYGFRFLAPSAAQEAADADLSASEGESGAEAGEGAAEALGQPDTTRYVAVEYDGGVIVAPESATTHVRRMGGGKCLHVWAEDTRVGDTTRYFICTECGTTRTEDRQ